jgi:hypothetical protein
VELQRDALDEEGDTEEEEEDRAEETDAPLHTRFFDSAAGHLNGSLTRLGEMRRDQLVARPPDAPHAGPSPKVPGTRSSTRAAT